MAKQSDETPKPPVDLASENAALREQVAAQAAQQDQILDYMAEMKTEIETLKAQPAAPVVDAASAQQKALDDEWAALREEFKDIPNIDIVEQRVLAGTDANTDIRLIDEPGMLVDPQATSRKWKLRWFNFATEGRSQRATQEGYVKVKWTELKDAESIATMERIDEFVRIGEKGKEVLHKIPLKLFAYKKKRDAARIQGMLSSESGLRDHLAANVARMAGNVGDNADQAGSLIQGNKTFMVEIKKGEKETVRL
jgi:hypothetical protein